MYQLFLTLLTITTLTSVSYSASEEPSYHDWLASGKTYLQNGEANKAAEALGLFVPVASELTREFNIRYAIEAAALLYEQLNEKPMAIRILDKIFSNNGAPNRFIDSSLYMSAAHLYLSYGETSKAEQLRRMADAQQRSAWGGKFKLPPEEIDYKALGLPDPRHQ